MHVDEAVGSGGLARGEVLVQSLVVGGVDAIPDWLVGITERVNAEVH